ncbi:MAG: hypothetical protein JW829_19475 [Pirellulales bacterium]|nr:hypothetical protein [Pirellulales bacterium]
MFVRGMICWQILILSIVVFPIAPCSAVASSSYTAQVITDGAAVRSGPGEAYYSTGQLDRGAQVEVYHRRDDGWCAIRPPEGSFSWVAAQHVRLSDDPGLGEIIHQRTPSRIGSQLDQQRHAVQVRLNQGELVEILHEEQVDGHSWYQIAPPRGEFRWIDEQDLNLATEPIPAQPAPDANEDSPSQGTARPWESEGSPEPDLKILTSPGHVSSPQIDDESKSQKSPSWKPSEHREMLEVKSLNAPRLHPADIPQTRMPPEGIPLKGNTIDPRSEQPSGAREYPWIHASSQWITSANGSDLLEDSKLQSDRWKPAGTPEWREPGRNASMPGRTDETVRITPSKRSAASAPATGTGSQGRSNLFADSLEAIDYELSRTVADHPRTWRFDRLRHRATVLLNTAPTPADAADAENLLAKIARFEEIQHRRSALANRARNIDQPGTNQALAKPEIRSNQSRALTPSDQATRAPYAYDSDDLLWIPESSSEPSGAERYDVVGVLKRVGSRRRDAPRFALVDPTGDIVSFITPSPGVNLQPFVGQRVGVYGTRGYMPEYRRAHVVAARVTPLDTRQ